MQVSRASSDGHWQHPPVIFQGVHLNSLGCHRYCMEAPPLPALSAQGSIRLLPGLDLPLDVFEVQCGTVVRTLFIYLTMPSLGYHVVCACCILDLLLFDTSRWWADPLPRLVIAAVGLEAVVLLQTINFLAAAVADSMPGHDDMYRVLLLHPLHTNVCSRWRGLRHPRPSAPTRDSVPAALSSTTAQWPDLTRLPLS